MLAVVRSSLHRRLLRRMMTTILKRWRTRKKPEEEHDDDQAKVEDEDASATEEWESEGEHEGVGADDGAQSFLSRRLPRRRTMTILTRWRMRKRLPPRKRKRRWTTRRTSDTIPTGKSTSGLSTKQLCMTPWLPINIIVKPGK